MRRSTRRRTKASALVRRAASAVIVGLVASCASAPSNAPPPGAPPPPPEPTEARAPDALPAARTATAVEPSTWSTLESALRAIETRRAEKALACWRGLPCEAPPVEPTPAHAADVLASVPEGRRQQDIVSALARVVLDDAAGPHKDLPLLASAEAQRLAEASIAWSPSVDEPAARAAHEAWAASVASVDEAAGKLGQTRASLIAARAGLTEPALRALADAVLSGPDLGGALAPFDLPRRWRGALVGVDAQAALVGPLVDVMPTAAQASEVAAPFAGCFLVDPPERIVVTRGRLSTPAGLVADRYARGSALGARLTPAGQLPDHVFIRATGTAAALSAPRATKESAEIAAWLRLRWAAASTLALLDDAALDVTHPAASAARDKLAARIVGAPLPTAGGGQMLGVHPSGAVAVELVARVAAAAMLTSLTSDLGSGWSARPAQRRRAADLLLLLFAEWRHNGVEGLIERAGASKVENLPPLGGS